MAEATNKLRRAGSDGLKKLHRNILIFCVGECKIPLNVKSKFSFFQNLNVQLRCLIFVEVPWIDDNSKCMQKK